jgi:hypothetical protein
LLLEQTYLFLLIGAHSLKLKGVGQAPLLLDTTPERQAYPGSARPLSRLHANVSALKPKGFFAEIVLKHR